MNQPLVFVGTWYGTGLRRGGTRDPRLVATLAFAALVSGCGHGKSAQRLNTPPQGDRGEISRHQQHYAYMTDNAMLADLSITDIHFLPQQAELSGLGEARLERYAELLEGRRATLHYVTALSDEDLLNRRLEAARQFLAARASQSAAIEIALGLRSGPPFPVREGIGVRDTGIAGYGERKEAPARRGGGGGSGGAAGGGGGYSGGGG